MLYLPATTPNYMLYIETGFNSLFISTIKMHFCYIKKVLSLNSERLPRILAEKVIELNLLWAKEWSNLCNVLQFSPPNNSNLLCFYWKEIICLLKINDKNDITTTALNS